MPSDAESQAETPAAEDAEPIAPSDDAEGANWRARLRQFGWGRSTLAVLGLLGLFLGMLNAWRAEASSTLLVVGGLLLVVALIIAPEWDEIRASHGGTEFLLKRYREGVQDALATSETPQELVERVEQLETTAQAAETAKAFERFRKKAAQMIGETLRREDEALNPGEIKADASVLGSLATLRLRARAARPGALFNSAECHVTDPHGRTASAVAPATPGAILSVRRFLLTYPRQFVDALPLEPGTYQVEWRRRPLAATTIASALARVAVATTTFTVPEATEQQETLPAG
jgi:hypothetical protein